MPTPLPHINVFNPTMPIRFQVISLYKKNKSKFDNNICSTLDLLTKSELIEDLYLAKEIINIHLLAI